MECVDNVDETGGERAKYGGDKKREGERKQNEDDGAFRRDGVERGRWRGRCGERVGRLVTSCADVPIHHKLLYSYYVPSDSCHPCRDSVRAARRASPACFVFARGFIAARGSMELIATT